MGTLLDVQGKEHHPALDFGEGDLGSVAKLKDAQTGDMLADKEVAIESPEFGFPEPVMSFAITPKSKGDKEKVATAIRRLAEEDPTLSPPARSADRRGDPLGHEPDARRSRARAAKRRFGVEIESIRHASRIARRFAARRARTAATRSRRVGEGNSATVTS